MTKPRVPQPDFGPTTQFDTVPATDVLLAGARVGGFRIVELLGRGESGVVYLALDSSLQRQVAIKEYFPGRLAERGEDLRIVPRRHVDAKLFEAGRQAFLQRAKLFARFDHPALVRVQSFWEENGSAYLSMNFVPGTPLGAALKALPRAPDEAWLRALLTPLLDAVDLLHAAQCQHGGISAEAIMVRNVGVPVLLGSTPPTPDDKPLAPPGPWTDLRALASLLHAAVTGQAALGAAVPRVHRPLTGLPYNARFLSGIDRALSVDPRQRLRSVAEFRRCLGWAEASAAAAPAAAVAPANATARAAAPAGYADRPQQPAVPAPPQRPPAPPRPGARSEPGFGDSRFQSRFDEVPVPAPPPPRRAGLWVVLLCAAALAGGAVWLQVTKSSRQAKAAAALNVAPAAIAPQVAPVAPQAAAPVVVEPVRAAESGDNGAPAEPEGVPTAPPPAAPAPEAAAPKIAPPVPLQGGGSAVAAVVAEAGSPRGACGTRTNFALLYCMQTQCARPQFARHAQCADLKRSGDLP